MAFIETITIESDPGAISTAYSAPTFRVRWIDTGGNEQTGVIVAAGGSVTVTGSSNDGVVSWDPDTRVLSDTAAATAFGDLTLNNVTISIQRYSYLDAGYTAATDTEFNVNLTDCNIYVSNGRAAFSTQADYAPTDASNDSVVWTLNRNTWVNSAPNTTIGWGLNTLNIADQFSGTQTNDTYLGYGQTDGGWFVQHNRVPTTFVASGTTFTGSVFNTGRDGTPLVGLEFDGRVRDQQGFAYTTRFDPLSVSWSPLVNSTYNGTNYDVAGLRLHFQPFGIGAGVTDQWLLLNNRYEEGPLIRKGNSTPGTFTAIEAYSWAPSFINGNTGSDATDIRLVGLPARTIQYGSTVDQSTDLAPSTGGLNTDAYDSSEFRWFSIEVDSSDVSATVVTTLSPALDFATGEASTTHSVIAKSYALEAAGNDYQVTTSHTPITWPAAVDATVSFAERDEYEYTPDAALNGRAEDYYFTSNITDLVDLHPIAKGLWYANDADAVVGSPTFVVGSNVTVDRNITIASSATGNNITDPTIILGQDNNITATGAIDSIEATGTTNNTLNLAGRDMPAGVTFNDWNIINFGTEINGVTFEGTRAALRFNNTGGAAFNVTNGVNMSNVSPANISIDGGGGTVVINLDESSTNVTDNSWVTAVNALTGFTVNVSVPSQQYTHEDQTGTWGVWNLTDSAWEDSPVRYTAGGTPNTFMSDSLDTDVYLLYWKRDSGTDAGFFGTQVVGFEPSSISAAGTEITISSVRGSAALYSPNSAITLSGGVTSAFPDTSIEGTGSASQLVISYRSRANAGITYNRNADVDKYLIAQATNEVDYIDVMGQRGLRADYITFGASDTRIDDLAVILDTAFVGESQEASAITDENGDEFPAASIRRFSGTLASGDPFTCASVIIYGNPAGLTPTELDRAFLNNNIATDQDVANAALAGVVSRDGSILPPDLTQ